jgi:hypothetical protein
LTIIIGYTPEQLVQQQVVNRAFVALAIEAGIETVIRSLVGLATTKQQLLLKLKLALADSNPPLAAALGLGTLEAILKYMGSKAAASAVVLEEDLPELLDQAGPASVSAGRDGGVNTQVNITFNEAPNGFIPELYLDGVYIRDSEVVPASGWVNDALSNVALGSHTIRVLYRRVVDGHQTRFGPVAQVS